jgi:tetratricopeptide (TPR) repeat protein
MRFLVGRAVEVCLVLVLLGLVGWGGADAWASVRSAYYRDKAREALRRQRYPQALEYLDEALRSRPKNAALCLLAGRTGRQAGKLAQAERHYQHYRALAGISADLQLEEYLWRAQNGGLDEVSPFLWEYLQREGPQSALVLESLCTANLQQHRLGMARVCVTRWLRLEPDNVAALFKQGLLHGQRNDFPGSLEVYRHGLQIDPDHRDMRLLFAQSLERTNEFEEAVREFERLLKDNPGNKDVRLGLARCRNLLDHPEEAVPLLDALHEEDPEDAQVLRELGRAALAQNRLVDAERWLVRACARARLDYESAYLLGRVWHIQGKKQQAREQFAHLQQLEKDGRRIEDITNKHLGLSPNDPALLSELGGIFLRYGENDEGVKWLERALLIAPDHRPSHQLLAAYYSRKGSAKPEKAAYHSKRSQPQATRPGLEAP